MSGLGLSRREFLAGAAAVVGAAAVPVALTAQSALAAAAKDFPWTYTSQDATAVAKRAYEVYFASGCAEATWWSFIEALAADGTNADQALWATLPKKMFAFGGGGVSGWGTLCGTCNGTAAVIKAVGAPNSLVDAIMLYYAETPLPTNAVDVLARAGWVPAAPAAAPIANAPSSIAHSQLCHSSISSWMTASGFKDGSAEQKDRCAKACFDMAYRTAELLNAWKSGSTPSVAYDPTVTECASTCHSATGVAAQKGKMACDSCHDLAADHLVK